MTGGIGTKRSPVMVLGRFLDPGCSPHVNLASVARMKFIIVRSGAPSPPMVLLSCVGFDIVKDTGALKRSQSSSVSVADVHLKGTS